MILLFSSKYFVYIFFFSFLFFLDKPHYSLVLEYADGGTLKNHLRNNAKIKWESQLKFAKEIAAAILWLHGNAIIHGDLVSIINYTILNGFHKA